MRQQIFSHWHKIFFHLLIILGLVGMPSVGWGQNTESDQYSHLNCLTNGDSEVALILDGVNIEVCTPFLTNPDFIASEPDSFVQSTTAIQYNPYRVFSIIAVPYGIKPATENLPMSMPGSVDTYRELLRSHRQSQNGTPQDGMTINIFGQTVTGLYSIVNLPIFTDDKVSVLIAEWVVEAGKRIWILRISQELRELVASATTTAEIAGLMVSSSIHSSNLAVPSTSLASTIKAESANSIQGAQPYSDLDLPSPSWWNGECNVNNNPGSYALGGNYQSVKACGPTGTAKVVRFFPGAWGELEWQCVELSMRFMYLAYGVKPYQANGKDVVNNFPVNTYPNLKVEKVANGTTNKAPRPGDILSYDITSDHGHTSVVAESNVDSNGNGTIKVIEQNYSRGGVRTHSVSNWVVKADLTVDKWLRFNSDGSPSNPSPNHPPNTPSLREPSDWYVSHDGLAPTLCWNNNGDPDNDQLKFYAEVFDSARGDSSGWTSNTCWRPGALDGGYFNYQWRAKARDSRGAESGWSETRHFTIEAPNQPPSISFNTANGKSDSEINTRDQNWTFSGTASDPENKLSKIEFHCHGDACNDDLSIGNSGNWSQTRNGLTGENRVWFTACDDKQCRDSKKRLLLRIDLASPTSSADANGQSNPSEWFRGAVDVKLRAQDGATGNAAVGIGEIRYRVDGGGWQSHGGDNKTVTVSGDGQHTVEYYAIDKVGNKETSHKTISFKIDATPPSAPGAASESGGAANNQWQKSVSTPDFTWGASNDSTSGLQHYELYFGPDANSDQIQSFVAANAPRQWTPLPNGVRTGTYYLRARARDNAGNYSAWATLFTFRFDNTAPPNPTSASHAAKLISESWQRTTSSANFTWTVPSDEGSGIKGYYIYWGDQSNGKDESAGALRTGASYQSAGALCPTGQVCTGYLRIRTVDNVDNLAGDWSTIFTVRYDGAAPTLNFSFNGGVTQTAQTLVTLSLDAHDEPGSGVREVRSFASSTWSAWEPYQNERSETIPAIGRQEWPVYVQVRDAVGWESTIVSKSVYFEVNRPQPKSANFWLFDGIFNAGNGNQNSTNYKLKSSVGQSLDSEPLLSTSYIISGGYQAASMAIPLQVPEHDEFNHVSGVIASGIVNDTTTSSNYRMLSSIGQMGLPDNAAKGTIASANYQLRPGFLAASPSVIASPTPPPAPTPGPTPAPEPPKGCEFATLTINNGAIFTNNPNVSLNLCAPAAQEMIVSNDGSFSGATWESFNTSKAWTLTTLGQNVVARLVQARFKDEQGNSYHYAVDDIIYDPTAPSGDIAINDPVPARLLNQMRAVNAAQDIQIQSSAAMESFSLGGITYLNRLGERRFDIPVPLLSDAASGALDVYLIAQDDNSGLQEMQVGEQVNLGGAAWQPYDGLIAWTPSSGDGEKQLYARFRDSAGNVSTAYSSTVVIDNHPPLGGINIVEGIVGENTVNVHLYLAAEDNLSDISAIRLSQDPTFADAPWQPFASEITWPIQVNANENEKNIYVQFRDAAGNVSQSYSDIVLIDQQPPLVYAEVEVSNSLERQINLYAYDELSALSEVRLSNDPLMSQGVVTMPYTDTVHWSFDDRRVVWIQIADTSGNLSEGYPAYAALPDEGTPTDKRVYLPLISR